MLETVNQHTTQPARLDLVTVVFRREVPLLELQARSIARFFDADAIANIYVIVNDRDEDAVLRAVEALRPLYGKLAERLVVLRPDEIRSKLHLPLHLRLERYWVANLRGRYRRLLPHSQRLANGWRGNGGWAIQQALKLLSANIVTASYILFLDAKNFFGRPVGRDGFVAADGRAKSRPMPLSVSRRRWTAAAFSALGLDPKTVPDEAIPTVTPMVIARDDLQEVVREAERNVGPLESFFARRKGRASEFMLLFAGIDRGTGRWWDVFAEGLSPSRTLFAKRGDADVQTLLHQVVENTPDIMGLHRSVFERIAPDTVEKLCAFWVGLGLFRDVAEARSTFPEFAGGAHA